MAFGYARGAIQWLATDGVNTTYTVIGLPFRPVALKFTWQGLGSASDTDSQTTTSRRGWGFAVSTSSRACVLTASIDGSANSSVTSAAHNAAVVATAAGAAFDGALDLNDLLSDGFSLIVDDQGVVDITVFWEAWGGLDIRSATVGTFKTPAATGTQDYSAPGFLTTDADDQVVMLAGVRNNGTLPASANAGGSLSVGYTTGTASGENIVVCGHAANGQATMVTRGYCKTGSCLAIFVSGGTSMDQEATLSTFLVDGFRLNYTSATTVNMNCIYMAIKGGRWKAGSYTIDGATLNATATVSGTFQPGGISLIGRRTVEQTLATVDTQDRMGFGSAASTSDRGAMGHLDEDATADTEIDLTLQYDQALAFPDTAGALGSAYDINTINSDGFQTIVDVAGGVANEWQGYLISAGNPALSNYIVRPTFRPAPFKPGLAR